MEPFFSRQLLKVFLEVQQGAEQQYDDVLMTCQVCSSNFPIQKYSILNVTDFIQYSKHKIQNVQGNPALIFNILVKKSEKTFSRALSISCCSVARSNFRVFMNAC